MLGYLAFGHTTKEIILYNLPDKDVLSILAKAFYLVAIAGSFILMMQPIFYVIEGAKWYEKLT